MKPLKKETFEYLVEMYKDRCISKSGGEKRAIEEARAILKETYQDDEESIKMWLQYLAQEKEEYLERLEKQTNFY
jgi:hypothetical protein